MNYVDSGSTKSYVRKAAKKTSLFYQQAQKDKEEDRYEKDTVNLKIFQDCQGLLPYKEHFVVRNNKFFELIEQIVKVEENLIEFAKGYYRYGFIVSDTGITFKLHAPGAQEVYLYGEFTNGEKTKFPLTKDSLNQWEIFLPKSDTDLEYPIQPDTYVKLYLKDANGNWVDRDPIYAYSFKLDKDGEQAATVQFPDFAWQFKAPAKPPQLCVMKVNIGSTINDYIQKELPLVSSNGYNALLLSNSESQFLFAFDNKLGASREYKDLIDKAHGFGLVVLLELNHRTFNFPTNYDGTDLYGKGGIYDYSNWEALRLLLSNIKYWIKEYQIDGFVMKNVSSMVYGNNVYSQSEEFSEQLSQQTNIDGLVYLMLANDSSQQIRGQNIMIADDTSNYPYMCKPIREGGIGFDLHLKNLSFNPNVFKEPSQEEESKQ